MKFDPSKFRKGLTKSIPELTSGFNDPDTWISTGSYALNYLISGRFDAGVPLGRVTIFAGESGSGKSYICSGNIVKNAQDQGIFVILIDSEAALDREWLEKLGVDTSEDKLLRVSLSMIDDVAKLLSEFMKDYVADNKDVEPSERPKILFVIDSLGMLMTPHDLNQFEAGDMKGNMGHTARQLKALVKNTVVKFENWNLGLVATNHTYASQDMFDPDDKIAGGCLTKDHKLYVIENNEQKLKNIQDVQIGDIVLTTNGTQQVLQLWNYKKPTITFEFEDGSKIECTEEHKFLTNSGWKEAKYLNENDEILKIE